MRRRARLLAAALIPALAWMLTGASEAGTRQIEAGGLALSYDDSAWRAEAAVAPELMRLICLTSACKGAIATLLSDPRPFPAAGSGAFTPGAVAALLLELRSQDLTPGARLRPEAPTEPVEIGTFAGYRNRFAVEDANLRPSSLIVLTFRHRGAALTLRLSAPKFDAPASAALDRLAAGLSARP